MIEKQISVERLNGILNDTINSITSSMNEVVEIVSYSLEECEDLEKKLKNLQFEMRRVISEVERLEVIDRVARNNLSKKNEKFEIYDESIIKEAYDLANEARVNLLLKREEEKNIREKREDMEIRLKSAQKVYQRAKNINSQISIASNYLIGNSENIVKTVDKLSQNHYLGLKIMEAQEEERHRLARDIHDGPTQSIANIILKVELCERLLELDKDKANEELNNLKLIARETLKELRKTIFDLRPMSLEDLGLIPTLERYIVIFKENTKIDIGLKTYGSFNNLNPAIHIAIFRIVQESLNNINKHSKASTAQIILERSQFKLNLSITDNGIGFDPENYKKNRNTIDSGFGLINIKERVGLLNGRIDITSSRESGTRLSISIPLEEGEN